MLDKYQTLKLILKTLEGHLLYQNLSDKTLETICDRLSIEPIKKENEVLK